MKEISESNFGIVIAFLLPGFVLLWGLSLSFELIDGWFKAFSQASSTVGTFLQVVLASLALGMLVSAVRWAIVDQLLFMLGWLSRGYWGVVPSSFSYVKLTKDDATFKVFLSLVENHYRYYQYYSNTFVSLLAALICCKIYNPADVTRLGALATSFSMITLLFASRDAFSKYHKRLQEIS